MTSAIAAAPRLYRRPDHGLLGGVAAGIAEHVRLPVRVVRFAFVVLVLTGGLGVALYGAYLIVVPVSPDAGRRRVPRWVEFVGATLAAVAAIGIAATSLPQGGLFLPALFACLGGALIWRQASDPERGRLRKLSRSSLTATGDTIGRVRFVAGLALVVAGGVAVLVRADFTAFRDGLLAMIVTLAGVALVTGPWWMRMATQLSAEREERARSQERADIAAHLHDSVLQTLALIQRNAGSPREVSRLARGQERELRRLLYDSHRASGDFGELLRAAAAEVEDAYAVSVDIVLVGAPIDVDAGLGAAAAAAREALVNAARHAGVTAVSVFAEIEDDEVSVFVKDRGAGFDLNRVGSDRQGVRGSIVGRVERHGGTATIRSTPGHGTEVEIHMPRVEVRT